ncbi:MAG: cobalamin-binding protein [Anaerolineales bacterium]|nr:cobalamin-binding protein [Anaerolineales bacterium]
MLRKTFILTLAFALLSACAPQPAPTSAPAATEIPATAAPTAEIAIAEVPAEISAVDGLGREVHLAALAARIVSLAPSNTEILYAIGAGNQVVGRDEFADYPAEAAAVESVGGSMGEFSAEAIVALEPDLVLAAEINTPELVNQLEKLGLTVYYLSNPKTIEEMYGNLEIVAQLSGHDVSDMIASLKERVAAVDEKIATITSRPTVFYEMDGTDPSKPWTYGLGTFGDLLISRAGGDNIGADSDNPYPQLSLEQIVVADPSIIILGDAAWGVTPEAVAARAGWETIAAVKSNQIYPIDDNLITRPGPRLVDGLEALAKLLHPELFE